MKRHLNLMTEESLQRSQRVAGLRRWTPLWAMLLSVLAVAVAVAWKEQCAAAREREFLEHSYDPVRHMRREVQALRSGRQQLLTEEPLLIQLAVDRPATTPLVRVAEAIARFPGQITIQEIHLGPLRGLPRRGASAPSTVSLPGTLTLEVLCAAGFDPSALEAALHKSPIGRTESNRTDRGGSTAGDLTPFRIVCWLE